MLTHSENRIFQLLRKGSSYAYVAQTLEISLANVYTQAHSIRTKLGLKNLQDPVETELYVRSLRPMVRGNRADRPTVAQMACLRLFAQGLDYHQIAMRLNLRSQSVQNHICQGCKRAFITSAGPFRQGMVIQWLKLNDGKQETTPLPSTTMEDPAFS